MKRRFAAGLAALVVVTAGILTASGAVAATPDVATAGAPSGGVTPNENLPVDIRVTDPNLRVVASFVGIGKQVYDCNASGGFTLREPVAGLFARGVPAGIHGKGPFWASFDGSHVDGTVVKAVPPPAPSDPNKNVAWVLLSGSQPTTPNPTTGVFSNVKFIQRLDTRGGVAPTDTCAQPKTVAVDYAANYVFWAPK